MKRIEDIKEFEDIDTYYNISKLVEEIFEDRVETHKQLVTANKEIERLNKALDEATKIINLKQKEIVRLSNNNRNAIEYIRYSLNNPMCYEREALEHSLELLEGGEDNE